MAGEYPDLRKGITPVVCMTPYGRAISLSSTLSTTLWSGENNSSGSGTFTVPDGVNVIEVSCCSTFGVNYELQCGAMTNVLTEDTALIGSLNEAPPGDMIHLMYIKVTPGETYDVVDYLKSSEAGYLMFNYSSKINNQTPDYDLTSY